MGSEVKVYIAGAGSFAVTVLHCLLQLEISVDGVIDEQQQSPWHDLPVYKASELDAAIPCVVFLAVSSAVHQQAALQRLTLAGVQRSQILNVQHDSALVLLESLFQLNYPVKPVLLSPPLVDMATVEQRILGPLSERLPAPQPDSPLISFHFYGRAGAYRQHLNPVAQQLAQTYQLVTFSDEPDKAEEKSVNLVLQSLSASEQNTSSALAISSRFWRCAHPAVPKLSCMHVIYDYDPFDRKADIAQPERHYIFASSKPAFDRMQQELIAGQFKNQVVLIPGGYPRLDSNRAQFQQYQGPVDCIIYAPTASMFDIPDCQWSYSLYHGVQILAALEKHFPQYRILFRPHPGDLAYLQSGKPAKAAQALRDTLAFCQQSRCELDLGGSSYMATYQRSALMVSDTSSTAFTFALTCRRPVVFYAPDNQKLMEKYGNFSSIKDRPAFGACVSDVQMLVSTVRNMLQAPGHYRERIELQTEKVLFNDGNTVSYFKDTVKAILGGYDLPGWWRLESGRCS